ncbi:hypothetical protein C5F64_15640, partial [Photobacterium damselae subsp. damselae]|uniref:hypothetical protein n=1 Tax=Photobacterium damselae TaxID=38293 RepID=UPI000D45EE57
DKLIESRHIPLVVIVMTKSLGNYDTTESLGDHTELELPTMKVLDINHLDYLLKSGVIGLVQVSKTPSFHHQQE